MTLSRKMLSYQELTQYIKEAKKRTAAMIGTGNHWRAWVKYPALFHEVDFVCVGIYPYWEGISIEKATAFLDKVMQKLNQLNKENKPIFLDSGWPTAGQKIKKAVPSLENQRRYLKDFISCCEKNKIQYFYFEAFDSPWKKFFEKEVGAHWGLYTTTRQPKY